jgi:single-strand DNA-binding protein
VLNKAFLIGRVGQDPEVRQTKTGKSVTNLSIATSNRFGGKEETTWHRVTAWGKTAEVIGEYVRKGRLVYVEGRIQNTQYTDKNGETKYATDIVADQVLFLSAPNSSATTTHADEQGYADEGYPEPGSDG